MSKLYLAAVTFLLLFEGSVVLAAHGPESVKSRISHGTATDGQKTAGDNDIPARLNPLPAKPKMGKGFFEAFPPDSIKYVEAFGDEVSLPTALIFNCLNQGRFEELKNPIAVFEAPGGRIFFTDGSSFKFNVFVNPADRSVHHIPTQVGDLTVPPLATALPANFALKTGMTRAEVGTHWHQDGGLSAPFRLERYVAENADSSGKHEVNKVAIAFKPAGMDDMLYQLGKWVIPETSSQDIVMRLSPVYTEKPFFD